MWAISHVFEAEASRRHAVYLALSACHVAVPCRHVVVLFNYRTPTAVVRSTNTDADGIDYLGKGAFEIQ